MNNNSFAFWARVHPFMIKKKYLNKKIYEQ